LLNTRLRSVFDSFMTSVADSQSEDVFGVEVRQIILRRSNRENFSPKAFLELKIDKKRVSRNNETTEPREIQPEGVFEIKN
jgi:hypothetical protein